MREQCKIAMLGYGGVNRGLVELIQAHNASGARPRISIVGVSDLYLGHCFDPDGLDADQLRDIPAEKGAFAVLGSSELDNEAVITASGCDVVAEATFSNMDTGEPARSLCEYALRAGKHVITTNKGSVAHGAALLEAAAARAGCQFLYEGAVMSGSPVLVWAKDCFPGEQITRIRGILNGTTNYILGQMEVGLTYAEALKQAQALGYAEADPTADLEGSDVRAKVIVLAYSLLKTSLSISDIACEGITSITPEMVAAATKAGRRWKLVADIVPTNDGVVASVGPVELSSEDPLFGVSQATNALELTTRSLGQTMVTGPGAGRIETAYAIFADLLRLTDPRSQPSERAYAE